MPGSERITPAASLGEGRWLEGVEEPCDGSSDCRALRHIHGCFADTDGNCDHPEEHDG